MVIELLLVISVVTIFDLTLKITIFAQNRIGSKSQFPCTIETILSIVAFCSFMLPYCNEIQSHSAEHWKYFHLLHYCSIACIVCVFGCIARCK